MRSPEGETKSIINKYLDRINFRFFYRSPLPPLLRGVAQPGGSAIGGCKHTNNCVHLTYDMQHDMQQKELQLAKQRQKVQGPEADLAAKQETVQALLIQYRTEAETKLQQKQLEIKNQQIAL